MAGAAAKLTTRLPTIVATGAWPAAAGVWLAHANGLLRNENLSILAFAWLLTAGCVGAPVGILRLLGRHLTRSACHTIAAACAALSALLTYLYATSALHPSTGALYASLMMTIAPAVHSYNASCWLKRTHAAHQAGVREGRALEAASQERGERLIQQLAEGKNADELRAWIAVLQDLYTGMESRERDQHEQWHDANHYRPHLVRSDERRTSSN